MKTLRLLIVDDDIDLRAALAESFTRQGYHVHTAARAQEALEAARDFAPHWALLDLKMPGMSGLALIPQLRAIDAGMRIVVLTGYASIATATEAIKLGAVHYLAKPVSTQEIIAAFARGEGDPKTPIEEDAQTLGAAERGHIESVLARHHGNISAAARELGIHRRTLQRKLGKRA